MEDRPHRNDEPNRQQTTRNRAAYDAMAETRDRRALPTWKISERQRVIDAFLHAEVREVLEIGAGPGTDAQAFVAAGLAMTCADLSPVSVRLCRDKGLEAVVMDFGDLRFPDERFDAVYANNCLLHVPAAELLGVLREIRRVLRPGGLFFYGTYGGRDHEGIYAKDAYRPQRFFSFRTDERLQETVRRLFGILWFRAVDVDEEDSDLHYQALLLQKPADGT